MMVTAPKIVAKSAMPLLVMLILARKQARWQWKYGADEHKHAWVLVLHHMDERIKACENYIAQQLDMTAFHAKREIIE